MNWRLAEHPSVQKEGLYYSAIAQFGFLNSEDAHLITSKNMGTIASRLQLGMEITEDIVDGVTPVLKDSDGNPIGLQLHRFNANGDLADAEGNVIADVRNEYSKEQMLRAVTYFQHTREQLQNNRKIIHFVALKYFISIFILSLLYNYFTIILNCCFSFSR